ncbi:MAG: hypothetical protein M0R66_08205 [Candidatus Omnitrophica bacterium]|nr:hypothetical protein [Candidatus Omnitrophota bacterium]
MKIKLVIITLGIGLLLAGCITPDKKNAKDKNIKTYLTDLDGDGKKEIVETEDRSITDYLSILSISTVKNKVKETTDSLSVPGKINKVEFPELNRDGTRQIAVYFIGQNSLSNIAVYDTNNNRLFKIFAASSAYGIDTDFGLVSRIKIGKAARYSNPTSFSMDWDNWVWSGNKFILD